MVNVWRYNVTNINSVDTCVMFELAVPGKVSKPRLENVFCLLLFWVFPDEGHDLFMFTSQENTHNFGCLWKISHHVLLTSLTLQFRSETAAVQWKELLLSAVVTAHRGHLVVPLVRTCQELGQAWQMFLYIFWCGQCELWKTSSSWYPLMRDALWVLQQPYSNVLLSCSCFICRWLH